MSVDAGSPLAREWAREEIKKLQLLDAHEAKEDEGIPGCPFERGIRAGIRCNKIIIFVVDDCLMRICPEPECVYKNG